MLKCDGSLIIRGVGTRYIKITNEMMTRGREGNERSDDIVINFPVGDFFNFQDYLERFEYKVFPSFASRYYIILKRYRLSLA